MTEMNLDIYVLGCRDGAVVRAHASCQCGPGSIPGLGVICGLSLLLVLYSGARFSKVPKLYGPFSGVTIQFVSQEGRGFNSSNFTVIFLTVTLKTC